MNYKNLSLFVLLSFFGFMLRAQPKIQLVDYVSGFVRPVDIAHCNDSRLFVVEQRGMIWVVDSLGVKQTPAFLNIDPVVRSTGNEQGLLGLAFHPDYADNGYFFVYYTYEPNGDTRVSRFTRDSLNANLADPNSELVLFEYPQPFTNHNGGCVKFGPDGYLYIGLGDGGSGGDPQGNGQKKNTFLGKILRIDVNSTNTPYAIPADNPFVNDPAFLPEIWSWGWRNPWRFSFDRLTGDMWVGDVGQNAWEEIDFEPAGAGGRDYGWRCYEGNHTYNTSGCPPAGNFQMPVFDYPNPATGCSVTGGFMYRGSQYSDLYNIYLFTDYCSGRWWISRPVPGGGFFTEQIADLANNQYSSLGEDKNGELYVALLASGKIQKIKEICSAFQISGTVQDAYCNGSFSGIIDLNVTGATGNVQFFWSNGTSDSLNVYLNPGDYTVVASDANGCERRDTFTVGAEVIVAPPQLMGVAPGDTLGLCPGTTTTLEVADLPTGNTLRWYRNGQLYFSGQQTQLDITQPGAYSVAVSELACASDTLGPVYVVGIQLPTPSISIAAGQAILCSGDTATLAANGVLPGYTIRWFKNGVEIPGATGNTLEVYEFGNYYIWLEGTCGTFESDPMLIDQEVVIPPAVGAVADTVFASPGWVAYQWLLDGQALPGATSDRVIALVSGFYTCIFTSPNGCTYADGVQVTISNTVLPENVLKCEIMPNPTPNVCQFELQLKKSEQVEIWLTDAKQREVFRQTIQGQNLSRAIDLHLLPAGTYFLQVKVGKEGFSRAIIKF